jgi:hypothetical protein
MQTSLVFLLMLGFSGCGLAQGFAATYRRIPYSQDNPPEHRDQLTTRAYRDGRLLWHGRPITMPVLQDYLRRSRALDPLPYLVLEYEAGIGTATLANLRRVFDEDGGCNRETICSERRTSVRQGQPSRRPGRRYLSDGTTAASGEVGLIRNGSGAPAGGSLASGAPSQACIRTTIAALGADPGRYDGRRVCVSGYFGRIVPYGETSFELFATRPEAEAARADFFLGLGIRWDVMLQERLSRHSANFARVEGIFEHDRQCWPDAGRTESDYICSPPRPMRIRNVLLRFSDGTEYRHPQFNERVQRSEEHPRGQGVRLVRSAFGSTSTQAMSNDRSGESHVTVPVFSDMLAQPSVTGRYTYSDGDRLVWQCRPNVECTDTLVRDERLQREVEISPDFWPTFRVERVPACGPRSSEVACYQSRDRTALVILEWVSVRRSNSSIPPPQIRNGASAGIQGANAVRASVPPRRRSAGRQGTTRGCEVSDLNAVFRNPVSYAGRKFCGEVLGIPQGPSITFFPPGYDHSSRFYDVAMFLSDRRGIDRLRLSQTSPFRAHVEGRIRPVEECFSAEAAQGQIECTPIRRPIILQVSRIGSVVANDGH